MIEKTFKVISDNGIHARSASELVKAAGEFNCDIKLTLDDTTVDFKSIMGVMSLGVYKDEIIKVVCHGIDEVEAMEHLQFLMDDLRIAKEY